MKSSSVGIRKWRDLDGDNTLALDWDLNEDSLVWEIGGFEGRWAEQIWKKFHCHIKIFEPQNWAVHRLLKRFMGIVKVDIMPYGLWVRNDVLIMGNFETDGASVVDNAKGPHSSIGVKDIIPEIYKDFQRHGGIIDLVLMNIEGAEFTILPYLISTGAMEYFDYFWCQFHPGLVDDGENQAKEIILGMAKTHDVLWECYPTAVAWRRRG